MAKKSETLSNEFACPECKEKLPLGTKKCKWCGAFITNPPTTHVEEVPKKKSWFRK